MENKIDFFILIEKEYRDVEFEDEVMTESGFKTIYPIINVLDNIEFEIGYKNNIYYVNCYAVDPEDSDAYSIRVYKTENRTLSDETEIDQTYFDSSGNSSEWISLYDPDTNEKLEELENFILDLLFGVEGKEGFIKPF